MGGGPLPLFDGSFQEILGLESEMTVSDLEEGGRNDGTIRRVGRARYQPLVCKRGMFVQGDGNAEPGLWQWFQDVVSGVRPVRRYDGAVLVKNQAHETKAVWQFRRALPMKIVGPQLNAMTGEIAIEELHLAHEGLFLEGTV
jgi:phage tail-like protein